MQMKALVVDLYAEVFEFLCITMQWYQHKLKRLRIAFNQNYVENTRKRVGKVQKIVARIRLAAEQATQSRVKDTDENMYSMVKDVKDMKQDLNYIKQLLNGTSDGDRQDNESPQKRLDQALKIFRELGDSGCNVLLAFGHHFIYGGRLTRMFSPNMHY